MSKLFFNFLFTTINRQKRKNLSIGIILTLLVFLVSSTLFISNSIEGTLRGAIKNQPDFILKRVRGGKELYTPINWEDKILNLYGVSSVTRRVYGRYNFDNSHYGVVIGLDALDEQNNKNFENILENSDIKKFISGDFMIIGSGVKRFLDNNSFSDSYTFLTANGKVVKLKILRVVDANLNLVSNDTILVPQNIAKDILSIPKGVVNDITFNVVSKEEWQNIELKISELFYDAKVIDKDEIKRYYSSLFNYKGGLFLMLFLVTLATFSLVLFERYSLASSGQKREIAILRAVGWSIKDILKLKFLEGAMLFFVSFVFGLTLAFIYVFYLGAPILKNIFLGSSNLKNVVSFDIVVDSTLLLSIFLLFGTTYIASILIPTWRVAVTDPKEAMK